MNLDDHQYFVSREDALNVIRNCCKEFSLDKLKSRLLEGYVHQIQPEDNGLLRYDRVGGLLDNVFRAIESNDASFFEERRGFKFDHVPDVQEFIESKEYLHDRNMWKSTKDNLWKIFHEPMENGRPPCLIVLAGAGGTGKSETAKGACLYQPFLIGCMWNPHLEFGMNPDSTMIIAIQSITKKTGEDSIYDKVLRAIDRCKWFTEHFPRRKDYNAEIRFVRAAFSIVPMTGNYLASKGKDVFGYVIGEINSAAIIEKSKRLQDTNKDRLHTGDEMYTTLMDRVESRFAQAEGGFPGKGIIDSQREHVGDFTDMMKERKKRNPNILIIEKTLWEAQAFKYPKDKDGDFIEGHFLVEAGDETKPTRLLNSIDDAIDPETIHKVPNRHKQTFIDDPEQAATHLIGVPTSAVGRFISTPQKITLAQTKFVERYGDMRLFKMESVNFNQLFKDTSPGGAVDWDLIINQEFIDKRLDKSLTVTCHIDAAYSGAGDALGLGLTSIIGTTKVSHGWEYCEVEKKLVQLSNYWAPIYCTFALLQVKARLGEETDLNFIRDLVDELHRRGLKVIYRSADWLEFKMTLQGWNRLDGVTADDVSVDKQPHAYYELRQAVKGERYIMQPHSICDRELRKLKLVKQGKNHKVDHPPNGSKDVADTCAGGVWVLRMQEGDYEVVNENNEFGQRSEPDDTGNYQHVRVQRR